jgi:hypothetical protein
MKQGTLNRFLLMWRTLTLQMGRRVSTLFLLVAIGLSACGGGGVDSTVDYTDAGNLSLVKLPEAWHTYELDELGSLSDVPFDEPYAGFAYPAVVSTAFDGAPSRDLSNVSVPLVEANFPIGLLSVRTVGETERQFLNRAALSQTILPYYQFLNATEHVREDFSFGDGFDGVRVLVSYADETGAQVGVAYLISVTDPEDNRMYSIVAGCSRQCYIDNQTQIEQVVDSWLVNKRAS